MKKKEKYLFHGGCHGCSLTLDNCPDCCFCERNWSLPNLNPASIKRKEERKEMIQLAYELKRKQSK